MNICVIGTGYVGLVSGLCLAEQKHKVICIDKDRKKISSIRKGISPIYEDGLDKLLKKNLNRNFFPSENLEQAIQNTDLCIVAVGTPFDGKRIDLSAIKEVASQIGKLLKGKNKYYTVVIKSTVIPGTTDEIIKNIIENCSKKIAGKGFGLAMNPEFLREGLAVSDFMYPDRIVIGGINKKSIEIVSNLYKNYRGVPIVKTNCKTAEMIKYTSNSLFATMISFTNEMANLCSKTPNVDIKDVMSAVYLDRRLSKAHDKNLPEFTTYLEAGCGFGGSCFPKDVKAIIEFGNNVDSDTKILKAVIQTNNNQPSKMIELAKNHFKSLKKIKISILGFSFKPQTNDIRESPALKITEKLIKEGAIIYAYDPVAKKEVLNHFKNQKIHFFDDLKSAILKADVVMIITKWDEFQKVPQLIRENNPSAILIDGRRMINKKFVKNYEGIGVKGSQ